MPISIYNHATPSMKNLFVLLIIAAGLAVPSYAQITCSNEIYAGETNYTNGSPNDSIYFICTGATAELTAIPPSGVPGWTFNWDNFVPASNAWTPMDVETDVPSSSQTVSPGGFRVNIFDGTNTLVGTYITWVCRVNSTPTVNISTIPAGCGNVNLAGLIFNSNITPYYNPPVDGGPVPTLIIDATTEISICYSGTHSWVSDLAFYVVGPASCGSPTLLLMPNPGAIGQGTVCNSGNNIVSLCFSTESTNNIDVCAGAPFTLQGTYGTYGPAATPIDWSLLYGCDAANAGWSVQIYDCIGGDIGSLTDATLTFSGTDNLGNPLAVSYTTPPGYNSAIDDNSCDPLSASIFQVGSNVVAATPIAHDIRYQWSADPPFDLPNSTSSLNLVLNPGPTVDTYFTLQITGDNPGAACGGNDIDTEFFDYIDPTNSVITPVEPFYCLQNEPFTLTSDQTGGSWSGTGVTNIGVFDPATAGPGAWIIDYTPSSPCIASSNVEIVVIDQPAATITPVPVLCSSSEPFNLSVDFTGGNWSGLGIIDDLQGILDPSLMNEGINTIQYALDGDCPIAGSIDIEVVAQNPLALTTPLDEVCVSADSIQLSANVSGGLWSGLGIVDEVNGWFDPSVSGAGSVDISYSYSAVCFDESSIEIVVVDTSLIINSLPVLCVTSDPITLQATVTGGVWSGPGIVNANTGLFDPSTVNGAGDYIINYDSNNACDASGSLLIEVEGVPEVNITVPMSICEDAANVTLTADVLGGTWSGNGIVNANTGVFDPSLASVGSTTITYTISGICTLSDAASIQVNPQPIVNAGSDIAICSDASAALTASGAQNYAWSPASGLTSTSTAATSASPNGTTTYTVTGTSSAGCSGTDQVVVTIYPEPNLVVNGPFTICEGDEIQLEASGLQNYSWTGFELSSNNISDPLASPGISELYQVEGTDANGCYAAESISVTVINPLVDFIPSVLEGISPVTVSFVNNSIGDSFVWDFGNGNSITSTDINFSPTEIFTGEFVYTVTLTSTLDGCEESMSIQIQSFYDSEIKVIPNVVTIGGDSKNDAFRILSSNMRTMDVQIFDRWGKNVGSIENPNARWDPKEYGSGTYYYIMKAEGLDGIKYDKAGHFTVLE